MPVDPLHPCARKARRVWLSTPQYADAVWKIGVYFLRVNLFSYQLLLILRWVSRLFSVIFKQYFCHLSADLINALLKKEMGRNGV
jgi:hypothetical protein